MIDEFHLDVPYKGVSRSYQVQVRQLGYTIKLEMIIDDTKVIFEPDEERNWRATISYEDAQSGKVVDPDLLRAITEVIEEGFK